MDDRTNKTGNGSYTAISLGWGIQSWTIAAMVALGELPMVDAAIHADTTHEKESTYAFAKEWTPWLIEHGVNVVTVTASNTDPIEMYSTGNVSVSIPAYLRDDDSNSRTGQINRNCTQAWKIQPIRKYLKKNASKHRPAELWLGITLDEWSRAKDSNVNFVVHKFPLLDMSMTRKACIRWLESKNLPVPDKSSCVFCPYMDNASWLEMPNKSMADYNKAVAIDEAVRNAKPPKKLFIHRNAKPLESVIAEQKDDDIPSTVLNEECDAGHCFL